ncbi:MAG: AAA family ATPase [Chloroflexi bacterium]|nr:AAA family ATPase [Chloroflexota bacterium]
MNLSDLLPLFPDARQNGAGYQAKCPGHDDRKASLSIAEKDGRLLMYCHAGCPTESILDTLGLRMTDLFETPNGNGHKPQGRIAAIYDYRNADGQLLYQVVRLEPKDFRQRRPDGSGGWIWHLDDTPRVLYRLPELRKADPGEWVFIVEGEKDAEALARLGLVATANCGGAGKWRPEYSAELSGRRVAILPDNDDPGRHHAQQIAASVHGRAAQVRIVEVPNLPPKGDVSDWLASGGTRDELLLLVEAAALYEPQFAATTEHPYTEGVVAANPDPLSGFIAADNLANGDSTSAVEWFPLLDVDGLVGRGIFTLLSARPKAGKTTLIAHAVKNWLFDGLRVAWLSEEPKPKWRERIAKLELAHGNLLLGFQDGAEPETWCERLRALAPDVIIVDTAREFLSIYDENDAGLVHRKLASLIMLARELNSALLVLHHRRKAAGAEGTDHAGSHAFVGSCDIAVSLREDAERRRHLSVRSRFDESPDKLLLELSIDGQYRALGRPDDVALEDVKRRVREVLAEDWQTTAQLLEAFDEPKPGRENLRRALHELHRAGAVERIEGRGSRPDQWRFVATTTSTYTCPVVATNGDEPDLDDAAWDALLESKGGAI